MILLSDCISLFNDWTLEPLLGDSFYWYQCRKCTCPSEEAESTTNQGSHHQSTNQDAAQSKSTSTTNQDAAQSKSTNQDAQSKSTKPVEGHVHHDEGLKRLALTWYTFVISLLLIVSTTRIDVVSIALFNLVHTSKVFTLDDDDNKLFHKNDIIEFIDEHWDLFWIRSKSLPWKG